MVTQKEVYPSMINLIIHAETISWSRFHNFLVFNTILILAWATIYVKAPRPYLAGYVMAILCVLGALSGIFWFGLGVRGRKFLKNYIDLATKFESDSTCWPNGLEPYKLGTRTNDWGKQLPYQWASSIYLIEGGSLALLFFYVFLFHVSIKLLA
ncbi:MAG: hypothetical protein ABIL62_14455 [Planctomycetota bacterium]